VTEGKATASKRRIAWGRYLLVFFVAAWMFVLGVLVGRGTAPVHFDTQALQEELAALRDAMMKKEREAVEKALRGEDEKAPLEFYEALKKDGLDTAVQIPTPAVSLDDPSSRAETVESVQPPHKSRTVAMVKKSKVPNKPTPGKSSSSPPAAVEIMGALTIQVASMKDGAAAERIVANLKKEGYPAYVSRIVIPGKGLWFRVRVGRYSDREQAAADMERLTRSRKKPILVER
jgi:cell division septation protein DedD